MKKPTNSKTSNNRYKNLTFVVTHNDFLKRKWFDFLIHKYDPLNLLKCLNGVKYTK